MVACKAWSLLNPKKNMHNPHIEHHLVCLIHEDIQSVASAVTQLHLKSDIICIELLKEAFSKKLYFAN